MKIVVLPSGVRYLKDHDGMLRVGIECSDEGATAAWFVVSARYKVSILC